MWNPIKIKLKNFLSHKDTEIDFPKDKLTLIFGKNLDDKNDGADSNGSGKSVLIEAVTLALTGSTYRDINNDDFILDGENECVVDFYLENLFLKSKLRILWNFERNKTSKIKIFENDSKEPLKQITSVNEAKKYILQKVGIDREDLLNFFIINQGNTNSFFTSGDSKQKEIIGRFANYKIVDSVIEGLSKERDVLLEEKIEIQTKVTSIESVIDSMNELIEFEKNSLESNIKEEVYELKNQIKQKEEQIKSLEKDLKIEEDKVVEFNEDIKSLDTEIQQTQEIIDTLEQIKLVVEGLQKDKKIINSKIQQYELTLGQSIHCPKCENEFILNSEKTKEEIELEVKSLKQELKKIDSEIDENKELLDELEQSEQLIDVLKNDRKKKKNSLTEVEDEISDITRNIKNCNKNISSLKQEIEEINSSEEKKSNIPTYEAKIKENEEKLLVVKEELSKKVESIEDKDYWLVHLGKKGFQTFLANRCIQIIQNVCNKYLEEMKVNLRVKINGFKVTASGELRDKIEVLIVKDGENIAKFNRFSGGQKERINLAGILTFHKLINDSLDGRGLNLLCLDESLDYLDEKGQKICLDILQYFDVTTMVISHSNVEAIIEDFNKIMVTYNNGYSQIQK